MLNVLCRLQACDDHLLRPDARRSTTSLRFGLPDGYRASAARRTAAELWRPPRFGAKTARIQVQAWYTLRQAKNGFVYRDDRDALLCLTQW